MFRNSSLLYWFVCYRSTQLLMLRLVNVSMMVLSMRSQWNGASISGQINTVLMDCCASLTTIGKISYICYCCFVIIVQFCVHWRIAVETTRVKKLSDGLVMCNFNYDVCWCYHARSVPLEWFLRNLFNIATKLLLLYSKWISVKGILTIPNYSKPLFVHFLVGNSIIF